MEISIDINDYLNEKSVTATIQKYIDQLHQAGGGRLTFASGVYPTGSLMLKSNVELHLQPGAVLRFSDDPKEYPVVVSRWEGVKREVYASCIYADGAENIAITGFGTLDGQGQKWWDIFRNHPEQLEYPRPKLISFDSCQQITLRDVCLVNSPSWTVNPILCQDITVDNIKIKNPADSPNTDGIDPESCKNVRISNCLIDVGDDCIAIKSGTEETKERVSCENITISNCQMLHGHGGVVLGSEMSGDIRNVTISNCIFQDTDRGIRLKSRRGRGGIIEDIRANNLIMDNVICPFTLNLYYFCGPKGKEKYVWDKNPYPISEETPQFRRIHFANISARNVHAAAGFIYGLSEQFISDISFHEVAISMAKEPIPGKPAMMTGMEEMTSQGFYIGCAKNIHFDRLELVDVENAFHIENSQEIEVERSKENGKPLVLHGGFS
ncbi:glycoside hydrolase family 28 protein [Enterococcus gallinarum]|uniref:glycoside hydrolase family 28 protein n=1 Tax=Enterococcus gallinarum TaxID=1353 RepID=UPI001D179850|nr:glycoside hydrolase family 28 protein [Enterococcus gallinarum]MCC4046134.1 glycoside hydrolase family 28 protein [Enterococcus gallinarum]